MDSDGLRLPPDRIAAERSIYLERDPAADPIVSASSRLVAGLIALLVFIAYTVTSMPGIDFGDSGDFALAAYVFGVPHPPGFPLLVLLGKLFMTIVPFGSIAWRMILISSAAGALACALVYSTVYFFGRKHIPGIIAALAFAGSHWLWSQSTIVEAYSLNVLFFLTTQYFFIVWIKTRQTKALYWTLFFAGLSLTNHLSIIFYLLIPIASFMVYEIVKRRLDIRVFTKGIIFFIIPLVLYVYLPIAASFDPVKNWGEPSSLKNFYYHVSMRQYQGFVGFLPVDMWVRTSLMMVRSLFSQFYLLCVLGIIGLVFVPKFARSYFYAVTVMAVGFAMTAARLFPDFFFHYIPVFAQFAIAIGFGADKALSYIHKLSSRRLVALGFMLLVSADLLIVGAVSAKEAFLDRNTFAVDFAKSILRSLPKNAILLSSHDNVQFPVQYVQYVEGYRKDVVVVLRKSLLSNREQDWMKRNGIRGIPLSSSEKSTKAIYNLVAKNPDRKIFLSQYEDVDDRLGLVFYEPLFELKIDQENKSEAYVLKKLPDKRYVDVSGYRYAYNLGALNLSRYYFYNREYSKADIIAQNILEIDPGDAQFWNGRSMIAGILGHKEEEYEFAEKALSANSADHNNYRRLAEIWSKRGDQEKALMYIKLALEYTMPSNLEQTIIYQYALAAQYLKVGDYAKAKTEAKRLLKYNVGTKNRALIEQIIDKADRSMGGSTGTEN